MPSAQRLSIVAACAASLAALTFTAVSAGADRSAADATTPAATSVATTPASTTPAEPVVDDCTTRKTSGTNCQNGNGRKVAGGGGKVSHKGWPAVTGLLWISQTAPGRTFVGTAKNDEILSHGNSDTIHGLAGNDILWGDWSSAGNTAAQNDVLDGGDGNDWIYTSHGKNTVTGGAGRDFIYAYYGRGTIDCGAGNQDTAKIHLDNNPYKVKNCERILNFCTHGSIGNRCAKPGEKKIVRRVK